MEDYIKYLENSYPNVELLQTYINDFLSLDLSTISNDKLYMGNKRANSYFWLHFLDIC